jgi:hypothetical protein
LRQYIPLPERSGYDDSQKEFETFQKGLRNDYRIIENSVFSVTSHQLSTSNGFSADSLSAPVAIFTETSSACGQVKACQDTPKEPNNARLAYELLQMRSEIVEIMESSFENLKVY